MRASTSLATLVVAFALTIISTAPLAAQSIRVTKEPASDSAAVADVVQAYHRALEQGDSASALRLLAPDAAILESGGIETREQYRGHHLPADIGFARAVPASRSPIQVVVRGDVAWAMSTSTSKGTFGQRAIDSRGAELMVLSREAGQWRIRAIHWSSRANR